MTLTDKVLLIPSDKNGESYTLAGKGLKHLVVVVARTSSGDVELELLDKMMKAIQYSLDEDVVLIIKEQDSLLAISNIVSSWQDMILFGVAPEEVGFQIDNNPYRILPFEKKRLLIVDSLQSISSSAEKKKVLWSLFQKMFLN